jgi:hypothetical protein
MGRLAGLATDIFYCTGQLYLPRLLFFFSLSLPPQADARLSLSHIHTHSFYLSLSLSLFLPVFLLPALAHDLWAHTFTASPELLLLHIRKSKRR